MWLRELEHSIHRCDRETRVSAGTSATAARGWDRQTSQFSANVLSSSSDIITASVIIVVSCCHVRQLQHASVYYRLLPTNKLSVRSNRLTRLSDVTRHLQVLWWVFSAIPFLTVQCSHVWFSSCTIHVLLRGFSVDSNSCRRLPLYRLRLYSLTQTRSQAVAMIADRTASQQTI